MTQNSTDTDLGPADGECIGCGADLSKYDAGTLHLGEYGDETDVLDFADGRGVCWLCIEGMTDFLLRKEKSPAEIVTEAEPNTQPER